MLSLPSLILLLSTLVQDPGGTPMPERRADGSEGRKLQKLLEPRLRDARTDFAGGDRKQALGHALAALSYGPAQARTLEQLLRLVRRDGGDQEAAWLWGLAWLRGRADAAGRVKLSREEKELIGKDRLEVLLPLVKTQAEAAAELARFAARLKGKRSRALGQGLLARWAMDLSLESFLQMPALQDAHAETLGRSLAAQHAAWAEVEKALEKVCVNPGKPLRDAQGKELDLAESLDLQMRAALALKGLAAQGSFKKLEGPRPGDTKGLRTKAEAAIARLRREVGTRSGTPLRIEQMKAMSEAEREAFNERHRTWASPGIAVSPRGWYRVETTCGLRTLLGVAETVEQHHERLVSHFGKDPFVDRPGLIRVVPESEGLESEGAPFWWAGGFQGGDTTTLRFAWGSVAGLGRALTHELTHRFDGVFHRGLPAWLGEGHAVWTGRSYSRIEDKAFVDEYLNYWAVQTPYVHGYAGGAKLRQLLDGTIDDYRDNYTAGYALYTFLKLWEIDGKRVFRKKLALYMRKAFLGRKKPVDWFVKHFADGKQGRPDGFENFRKVWSDFLRGCYDKCWNKTVPWIDRYVVRIPGSRRNALVLDEPTWSWARNRAEPWFGQGHAFDAGRILARLGRSREACLALLWALQVDGWRLPITELLAPQLARIGRQDLVWTLERLAAPRYPERSPSLRGQSLLQGLPKLRAYGHRLLATADQLAAQHHDFAARALREEHANLAGWTGWKTQRPPALARAPRIFYPLTEPEHPLGLFGYQEDGLTGAEERRVPGLWYETDEGDLHVGRKRPRDKTGVLDKRARIRDAFVRTIEWMAPGEYVIRARIHITTSYVNGGLVIGYTRRDRNLRLTFTAGDYLVSIGKKQTDKIEIKKVRFGLRGLWEREGKLSRSNPGATRTWKNPTSFFAVEAHVSGPTVRIRIDGKPLFSYTTPDLSPIEGQVGLYLHNGAVRLHHPTLQRLDRGNLRGLRREPGFDPSRPDPRSLAQLLGRPSRLPTSPEGSLILWLPKKLAKDADPTTTLAMAARQLRKLLTDPLHYPQTWHLYTPTSKPRKAGEPSDDDIALLIPPLFKKRAELHHHTLTTTPFTKHPWLLFVDAQGVLREAVTLTRKRPGPKSIERWARCYRTR